MLLLSALMGVSWACEGPSASHQVSAAIDEALEQYRQLEIDRFRAQVDVAKAHIGCLETFLSRHLAAEYHRAQGIRLFVDRNSSDAQKHFAAARVLEPSFTFPTDLVPEGNPLLDDYRALEPQPASFDELARPAVGTIKLDGSTTRKRGAGRPVIFQLADGSGKVVLSEALAPEQAPSAYDVEGEGVATTDGGGKPKREKGARKGPNVPLLIVAGTAAVAAGALYGGAFATRSNWQGVPANSGDTDKVDAARGLTNGLVVGSWIAGGIAVGTGTTAFVVNGRF